MVALFTIAALLIGIWCASVWFTMFVVWLVTGNVPDSGDF